LTNAAMGIANLQKYLQDTYNDLDKLIQYTYVSVFYIIIAIVIEITCPICIVPYLVFL